MLTNFAPAIVPGSFRAPFQKLADDPAAKALRRLAAAYILDVGAVDPVRAKAIADALDFAIKNSPHGRA